MKFGASSWPFQWDPPYEDCIKRVADNGFRAIELIAWNRDYLKDYYTPQKIADLKKALADNGIIISQFVHTPHDLSNADAGARRVAVDDWKRAVEVGKALGSTLINMVSAHPFGMKDVVNYPRITTKPLVQQYATRDVPGGVDWDQNFSDYVDALRACAQACGDAGVEMTVEPHPGRYLGNHDGALRLLDHVDHPAMGINFDPSHTFPVGDFPNISIYRLNRHIKHCHVSDNDAVTNVHWRPGMGKIDWVAFMQALKDVGFDGVVSIELEDVPGVSRGPNSSAPGVFRNVTATQEFVDETVKGMQFLRAIAKDIGMRVED